MINNEPIIQEFDQFILRFGGIYRNFYVGITDKPMHRINDEHEIGLAIPYVLKEAGDFEAAKMIERYFIDLGCDGGSGGDHRGMLWHHTERPG